VDFDNDTIRVFLVYWYQNGQLRSDFSNETLTVQATELYKGDNWFFVILVTDNDQQWSLNYTSQIIVILNSNPSINNLSFEFINENVESSSSSRDFYLNDEEISINYDFNDIDNDADLSTIYWYKNGVLQSGLTNLSFISSGLTSLGETWYVVVIPFDGEAIGSQIQSSEIIIESAPEIHNVWVEIPESESFDSEGYYQIFILTNNFNFNISTVAIVLNPDVQDNSAVSELIDTLSITTYSARSNGTIDVWTYSSIDVIQSINRSKFSSFLGKNITIQIRVSSIIQRSNLNYTIHRQRVLSFLIEDNTPPTIENVVVIFDNANNPSEATFYVEINEFGAGIQNATLFYFFKPVTNDINEINLKQVQNELITQDYNIISLNYLNSTYYTAIINFNINSSVSLLYVIQISDKSGNFNANAWPDGSDDQALKLSLSNIGLTFEVVFGLAIVILVLATIFSFVVIKKFRSTEIVGLDVEKVMEEARKIPWEEIDKNLDEHSMGIIISTFDQSHGPIPIFVHPDMLKDNIDKLIDLSDRSFSSTRFIENFEKEIQTMFEYNMTPTLNITSISFGYSLNRPDLRGGAENITMNILMHKPFETIIAQFLKVLSPDVHEIHQLMDQEPDQKSQIQERIRLIRKTVSSIVLAYEKLYEDMPIEELE
jgi:uncharacterized membrane protein